MTLIATRTSDVGRTRIRKNCFRKYTNKRESSAKAMAKELFDYGVNAFVDHREYDAPDEVVLPGMVGAGADTALVEAFTAQAQSAGPATETINCAVKGIVGEHGGLVKAQGSCNYC